MDRKATLPVVLIAASLVLLLVWFAQCAAERDQEMPAEEPIAQSTPSEEPAAEAPPAPPVEERQPESPAPRQPAPGPRPTERGVVELVKDWVGAWSEQRVDDYLECYARTFVPEGGISRRRWEGERRQRIAAPRFVRVSITGLKIELLDIGSARATFLQHYRSEGYTDTVRKTLDLVWEDGRWRIQHERSAGAG